MTVKYGSAQLNFCLLPDNMPIFYIFWEKKAEKTALNS